MIVLNLGCGINRTKFDGNPFPDGTIHIDHNAEVGATIVAELEHGIPEGYTVYDGDADMEGKFHSLVNCVDEIHAYHLIEHIGRMGETEVWFDFWRSCWKALKPGGMMYVVAPYYLHECAIGDPTHTRLIAPQTFHFLNRDSYKVGAEDKGSSMSKLSINFDLPLVGLKLFKSKEEDMFPSVILAGLMARKTQDGQLVEAESKVMEAV
jgi:hypothetical protein